MGRANTALIHLTGGVSFSVDPTKMDAPAIFSKVDYCLRRDDGLVTCVTNVSQITTQRQSEFIFISYLLLINTFKTYTFSLTREQDAQGTYCALTVALNN